MSKDQRPYAQAARAIHPERRATPRTAIRRPAYINFQPYNRGGVIIDISETGLRFHTVDVLEQGGIVRASIFLAPANHLEVVGELVWKDDTRRVGGLRFVVLPAEAADQIRAWAEGPVGASNGTEQSKPDASPQTGASEQAASQPSVSQTSPLSDAPPPVENQVAENKADIPVAPHPLQPVSPQAAPPQPLPQQSGKESSTRTPWVPPSMRPSGAAPAVPTHSQGLPSEATLTAPRQPWNPSAIYQQPGTMPWVTHFDPDPPAGRPFVRGVVGGIIVCLILGAAGWYAAQHYGSAAGPFTFNNPFTFHRNGSAPMASQSASPSADSSAALPTDAAKDTSPLSSLPQLKQPLAPAQEVPPSATPTAVPNPNLQSNSTGQPGPSTQPAPSADLGPAGTSAPESKIAAASQVPATPQNREAAQAPIAQLAPNSSIGGEKTPLPDAPLALAKATAPQVPRLADTGESQLILARQYLDGRSHPRNPSAASQLLWSAVEKGNSAAEMDLADLYLRGDGVARNCAQARVLLSAASGKGNPEAMEKLAELNRTGCR